MLEMRFAIRCGLLVLAICALFVSPVILIYGPLFAYGFAVDLVRIDGVLIAAVIMASALTVWAIIKLRDVRATATALFRRSYRPT